MKLTHLAFFLLPICALAIEPKQETTLAPEDIGLTKSTYAAAAGKLIVSKITVMEDGVVKSEIESVQANAGINQITVLHGTPPWSRGPVFHAGGLSFRFNTGEIVAITGNNSDSIDFKLKARPDKNLQVSIRIRELPYDDAKAAHPDIPPMPVAGTDNTSWWKRYDIVKTERPAPPAPNAPAQARDQPKE